MTRRACGVSEAAIASIASSSRIAGVVTLTPTITSSWRGAANTSRAASGSWSMFASNSRRIPASGNGPEPPMITTER